MLSETRAKAALKRLDWPAFQAEMDSCGSVSDAVDEALGHFQRENDLIFPYPNPKREKLRAAFVEKFRAYAHEKLGVETADEVSSVADLQQLIERGYRQIIDLLAQCDVSKLDAEMRVAACVSRAAHEYDHVVRQVRDALGRGEGFGPFLQGPLETNTNTHFSPDGAVEGIATSLTSTLLMEAHKNNWYDVDGVVSLPSLPPVGEKERYMAGSTELLAFMWRAWRNSERRLRYIGVHTEEFVAPNMPDWAPKDADRATVFNPTEDEYYDYIANQRLCDRFTQHFIEMHTELDLRAKLVKSGQAAALLPTAYISEEEVHAAVALSDILSYSIAEDTDAPGGIRIVEWLRGFAVLKQLAEEAGYQESENPETLVPLVTYEAIMKRLGNAGLESGRAAVFIATVVLKKESRDLFDCPLIKTQADKYLLFAPAALSVNLAQVVLSTLSNLGEAFQKKGKAFEHDVQRMLRKAGLKPKAFKVKRGGEEYEYDAVLLWGEYVFVFECKHHGLSHGNPIQAYHFALQARSNAKQVNRLADALRKYPDILLEKFGTELSSRKIVPCIINALPYSRKGQLDGVYFTDKSALGRFLQEKYSHIIVHHSLTADIRLRHRVAVHSFWAGEAPSASDLVHHLTKPYQITAMESHIDRRAIPFHIGGKEWVVAVEFERSAMNIESIANVAKVSPELVCSELEAVAAATRDSQLQFRKRAKSSPKESLRKKLRRGNRSLK